MPKKPIKAKYARDEMITISFKATQEEWDLLDRYCQKKAVTKTSVLRMAIAALEKTLKKGGESN